MISWWGECYLDKDYIGPHQKYVPKKTIKDVEVVYHEDWNRKSLINLMNNYVTLKLEIKLSQNCKL